MSRFKKLAHAVWDCKYHVVWCPKYRYRVLGGRVRRSARAVIRELCDRRGVGILEGSIGEDHIHLVVEVPPKWSISEVVGFIKGKSAVKLLDIHPEMRQRYWGRHLCDRGYFGAAIGAVTEEQIKQYIENQSDEADSFKVWDESDSTELQSD